MSRDLLDLVGCTDVTAWNRLGEGRLPGLVGLEMVAISADRLESRLAVSPGLMAPNGFLHAASVIALADTTCGYATVFNLPPGAVGFTTVELKSNFLGTAVDGTLHCVATPLHRGRTTQVWDAAVRHGPDGRPLAAFRCTQVILSGAGR
ncbi:MAG TPA: PaaI family thioesterase [Gammaproteobacteria bacterium]